MDSNPSWSNCAPFGENQLDPNCMNFDELSEYLMLDYRVDDHQDLSSLRMISPETCHSTAAAAAGGSSSATSRNSSTNMQVEYIPFNFLILLFLENYGSALLFSS